MVGLCDLGDCWLDCATWGIAGWSVGPGGLLVGLRDLGDCWLVCVAWGIAGWTV